MSRSHSSRWRYAVIWGLLGLVVVALLAASSHPSLALAALVVAGLGAWLSSPMRGDRSLSHWDAQQRHVRDGWVVVYWRPGSFHCLRLRSALGSAARRVLWVNVWADDEGAAFVRDVNGGSEVVPTAILGNGDAVTQPTAEALKTDMSPQSAPRARSRSSRWAGCPRVFRGFRGSHGSPLTRESDADGDRRQRQ